MNDSTNMTETETEEEIRVQIGADEPQEVSDGESDYSSSFGEDTSADDDDDDDEVNASQAQTVDEQPYRVPYQSDEGNVVDGDIPIAAPTIQDDNTNNEPDTNSLMDETGLVEMGLSNEEELNCCSLLARLFCWPILIPVLFIAFFVFIFFFTVPLMMFALGLTCLYYCCTRDPIPPRVLWAAMWQDELVLSPNDEESGIRSFGVVHTADQLKSMCVRRTLLQRIPLDDEQIVSSGDNEETRIVHTTHETLIFSAPLLDDLGTKLRDVEGSPSSHCHKKRQQNNESECIDVESGEQRKKGSSIGKSSGHSRKLDESEGTLHSSHPNTLRHQVVTADDSEWAREAACDICLLEYEPGDVVAWSHNPACSHAYHEDCIADWLVRNLSCPSCRQDFVRADDMLKERKRHNA